MPDLFSMSVKLSNNLVVLFFQKGYQSLIVNHNNMLFVFQQIENL